MIAASEPQEFIPFGRQQILEHPGAIQIGIQEYQYQSECALSNRLKEVVLTDSGKKTESWILRETVNEAIECEEELYFKGKTVVWSVGPALTENRTNRILKCCYTSETLVNEALWCNFHLSTPDISSVYLKEPGKIKQININSKNGSINEDLKNCVCIMDANHIKFYTKSGKEYLTTLQFKVLKIWTMKYGLIFERQLEKKEAVEEVGDLKDKKPEFSTLSPQSFRVSYRTSSMDLRRQSIEQSFLQNQKNLTDFTDKSTFGSTQYLNLPCSIQDEFSPLMITSASASSSSTDENTTDLPIIFSLSHPLDEICPVVAKNETLSYISNPDVKIIFTSENPSLCMTYDGKTKLHSVHFIRKAQPQESEICLHRESVLSRNSRTHHSFNTTGKPCFSNSASSSFNLQTGNVSMPAFLNARTRKSLGLTHTVFPNIGNSPFPTFERPRHSSPIPSRNISPAFSHNLYTPSPKRNDLSLNSIYGGTPNRIESRMMTEDIEYAEPKPLYPQICLQHLWTESCSSDNSGVSLEAGKAFLTKDLCGQSYLCYLIKTKHILNLLEMKNGKDGSVMFGAVSCINAKDACELTSLDMIAIIALDGGVELYSGVSPVAKILISGVPSCVATSSYLSDSNSGPSFFKRTSLNTFPKRSSLISQSVLSQSQQSPLFNDSLSQLSPVTTIDSSGYDKLTPNVISKNSNFVSSPREGYLIALRDSVANRISLEFSTGILFRMEMPNFGNSSLVKSCLNALRQVLPKESYLKLCIKWYCTRNVPGCQSVEADEEWSMFSDVLLELIGYDVELLKGTKLDVEKSPVIRAKKQKKCEKSGDEDWIYLIESKHHELCYDHTRHVLGFGRVDDSNKMDFECFSGITETPNIASRSGSSESRYDVFDASRTPVDRSRHFAGKFKPSFSKMQEKSNLESIAETPFPPKASYGKPKVNINRFKMCLDQGDISPIAAYETPRRIYEEDTCVNKKGPLYPFITWILFALHLLYEDMKLNELKKRFLPTLAKLLHHLACDLKLPGYVHHYWRDFPNICPFNEPSCSGEPRIEVSNFPHEFRSDPPNIFRHFYEMMLKKTVEPYPFVSKLNSRTRELIQLIGLLSYGYENPGISLDALVKSVNLIPTPMDKPVNKGKSPRSRSHRPIPHRVVLLMIQMGITQDNMQTLPPGVSLILYEALYSCRDNPGFGWSKEAYKLAMRHDLASFCRQNSKEEVGPTNELIMPSASSSCKNSSTIRMNIDLEEDGMEDLANMDVLKLRFSTDQRVLEARRMLQSAQPVRITIQQRPDVTDHEFIQEQEKHLYAICLRTMALPVGRGMMTLRTSTPVITEKLPIPPLCLTGRVPPTDKVVDMSHIEVASNMNVWPLFHNGVAAGLRISPNAPDIDSQWIIFNKPKTNNEEVIEHAGFLMALGLNGHLNNLIDTNIFHYLIKINEMTSVGLLLGIAASKRGTMDPYTVRIVSLHIEAMLPPTGIELDVDVVVEPAALISLGFLFQGTAHRHIAQVLLQEIGRPPGPEMANSVDRESYSLAAGLALGLVVFGRGDKLSGIGDMAIADTLHHYMVGGPKRPYLGSQREKYRTPSFLIWEGDLVNTHVTGPGAVLALGMLYFNTGNKAVAEWLKAPETQHLLEVVLPDALLLRTLAKGLILWNEIEPTESWVMSHVPEFTRPYCLVKPETNTDKCIDYETMDQAYCNIVAGACMAIGLRFAGSAYEEAFETLLSYAKMFTSLLGKNIGELCGRSTIETCLNVVTVSLAMVMAGTGDLEVLRLCRYLRSRIGPTNTVVTYGSHLATHMAIGLLFLGGGAYTLSTSPEAIAALLCAFYPKWPIHSNDNRYHLQALRHLYVLAVEPRLLLPRDIDTRTLCYAHITCLYLDVPLYRNRVIKLRAPCLLPELSLLKEVRIDDNRYWSIIFTRDKNWDDFTNILSECSFVDVKQKAGCLSYLEDPQGFRSLLAQTLTSDEVVPWTIRVETIFGFSSDPILVNFTQYFLEGRDNRENKTAEDKMVMWLTYIAYYCLTKDKLSLLPIWVSLLKAGQNVFLNSSSIDVWQLKLMWCQALRSSGSNNAAALIPPDSVLSIKQFFHECFQSWESDILCSVRDYLRKKLDPSSKDQDKLTAYLTFHDIPRLEDVDWSEGMPGIVQQLTERQLSAAAIMKIASVLEKSMRAHLYLGKHAIAGNPWDLPMTRWLCHRKFYFKYGSFDRCYLRSNVGNFSRYVLHRACMLTPSTYFLKRVERLLSLKVPNDDPTKPPLRVNIPEESSHPGDGSQVVSSSDHDRKNVAEPRSRSLVTRSRAPVLNSGFKEHALAECDSESHLSQLDVGDILMETDDSSNLSGTTLGNYVSESAPKASANENSALGARSENGYEEGLTTPLNDPVTGEALAKSYANSQAFSEGEGREVKLEPTVGVNEEPVQRILYAFVDPAEDSAGKVQYKSVADSCKEGGRTPPALLQDDFATFKMLPHKVPVTKTSKPKMSSRRAENVSPRKSKSASKVVGRKPTMRFEVQEIEEPVTYVVHSRQGKENLKSFKVERVPEKELTTRSESTSGTVAPIRVHGNPGMGFRGLQNEVASVEELPSFVKAGDGRKKQKFQKSDTRYQRAARAKAHPVNRSVQPSSAPTERSKIPVAVLSDPSHVAGAHAQEHGAVEAERGKGAADDFKEDFKMPVQAADNSTSRVSGAVPTKESAVEAEPEYNLTKEELDPSDGPVEAWKEKEMASGYNSPWEGSVKDDSAVREVRKSPGRETRGEKQTLKREKRASKKRGKYADSEGAPDKVEPENTKTGGKCSKEADFKTSERFVSIGCDKMPFLTMKFSSAFPPLLCEALKIRGRILGFRREFLFNEKWTGRLDFAPNCSDMTPKPPPKKSSSVDLSGNSILFPKAETEKFDCSSLFGEKDKMSLSGLSCGREGEKAPKISDNFANVANESLTESKGSPSVDSLSMMKKVKEMIDIDLENAIKIFKKEEVPSEASSVVVTEGETWRVDTEALDAYMRTRRAESSGGEGERKSKAKIQDVSREAPKYLPPRGETKCDLKLSGSTDSVVAFNPLTNEFFLNAEALDKAIRRRAEESFDVVIVETLEGQLTKGRGEERMAMFDAKGGVVCEMKGGDSILVFDEETQNWKVDYSILEKREQQLRIEEELTKRSELILERFEELEKGNMATIPLPDSKGKKVFDYNKEEWKNYPTEKMSSKAPTKSKLPFKESSADEIRRSNSDLYENLFMENKKDATVNKNKSSDQSDKGSKSCSSNQEKASGSGAEGKSEIPKAPESKAPTSDSGGGQPCKQSNEEDSFWESFLNMNILPRDISELPKIKRSPPPTLPPPKQTPPMKEPPSLPPPTPPPKQPPQPTKLDIKKDEPKPKPLPIGKIDVPRHIIQGTRIEEPKFKIQIPFIEDRKIPVKETPKTDPKKKPQEPPISSTKQEAEVKAPAKEVPKEKDPKKKPPEGPSSFSVDKKPGTEGSSPPPTRSPKIEDPKGSKSTPSIGAPNASPKKTLSSLATPKPSVKGQASSLTGLNQASVPGIREPKSPAGGKKDKSAANHYISENIVEMSRNSAKESPGRLRTNKIETVKLNITSDKRVPSKVTEINLNKKCEEKGKETGATLTKKAPSDSKKPSDDALKKKDKSSIENRAFYKNFEKYKTPFSDPEYEEKPMKIKSDIESNPNLKKLDNWSKTLVLHDTGKPPENIETWLKDETDKMATLLLKVLQDAADGKPRKKQPLVKPKPGDKVPGKPGTFDASQKKCETTPENFLFRIRTVNLSLDNEKTKPTEDRKTPPKPTDGSAQPQDVTKPYNPTDSAKVFSPKEAPFSNTVPTLRNETPSPSTGLHKPPLPQTSSSSMEAIPTSKYLDYHVLPLQITEEVPGPEYLKKLSNAWKTLPIIGSQLTIFVLLRSFQLVNLGSSLLGNHPDKTRVDAFAKLFNRYGPIVNIQGPLSGNVVLIQKPEHLNAVFEQDFLASVRSVCDSLDQCHREKEDKVLSAAVSTDWSKPEWNELKRGSTDPILKGSEKFFESADYAGDVLVSSIRKARNPQNLVSEDFMEEIKRWSLEGICNVVFEKSFGFLDRKDSNRNWIMEPDKLFSAVEEATKCLNKCEKGFQTWRVMATPSSAGLNQACRSISAMLSKQLYQAELSLKSKSEVIRDRNMFTLEDLTFVESMLLNDGMTAEEITCNLIDIILLGTNMMNAALGFLLYDLAQNVKVQNKLLQELQAALPDKKSRLDFKNLQSLNYLQACLRESLRLHIPVPVFYRMLQNDILLSNYFIPKGTYIVMDLKVNCMKDQVFEEPDRFIPERWMNEEKWMRNVHPLDVFPLCHGPRSELVKKIVDMQILACSAKVVRNFKIEYHYGDIEGTNSLISVPDKPLKLNFTERDS